MTDPLNVTPTIEDIRRDMYDRQLARNTRVPFDGPSLRQLRKQRGISRAALAEHMGVSPHTISNWELGKNRPSSFDVRWLAEKFTRWGG